jgi:hypothetical protein
VPVQVGLPVKPVTVKTAGDASVALADAGDAVPVAQLRETVTLAPLLGTKSLRTSKVAVLRLLTMVQKPALRAAAHVPLEVYPVGIGDSVPVQVGLPVWPVTVKTAGVDSVALAEAGEAVPLAQLRETVTLAPLFGTKSFRTSNVAVFRLLTMVQKPALSAAEQVPVEVYPVGMGDSVPVQLGLPV